MAQDVNRNPRNRAMTTAVLFLILSVGILSAVVYMILSPGKGRAPIPGSGYIPNREESVVAFASEEDFREYLHSADVLQSGMPDFMGPTDFGFARGAVPALDVVSEGAAVGIPAPGGGTVPDRFSTTNVQIAGIDEPDIVKTDGAYLYTSTLPTYFEPFPLWREDVLVPDRYIPPEPQGETHIVQAFPPEQLAKRGSIDEYGELLIVNKTLIVVSLKGLTGYDVTNPALPVEAWNIEFEDNHSLHAARLFGNTLYFVLRAPVNRPRPCPYIPLSGRTSISVRCEDIYHPTVPVAVDSTFTVTSVQAETGQATDTVSFVGSSDSSIVSMSHEAVYVTYSYTMPYADIFTGFIAEEGEGLIPESLTERVEKVQTYDISAQAKFVEIEQLLDDYLRTLDPDEQRTFEAESTNRMKQYATRHSREFETTGIVKVSRRDLTVQEVGSVPGRPLNQFSLDEFNGHVRIATTLGSTFFSMGDESFSDVYILDDQMRITGSVQDLGRGERIYAVRFVGDTGYVVTFRETDPFYVLDLSRPRRPLLAGELKIPGYSSYLHPISDSLILGVGKEGQSVKLSLFDVSDPSSPTESDKYILSDYWSDILNTHHAFLLDDRHGIFFIPGSEGGYIFSYGGGKLSLVKAVDVQQAKRAIFIDDYLYIVSETEIIVLDETSWERVGEIRL